MYPFGGIGILKNSDSLKHSFHVENVSCIGLSWDMNTPFGCLPHKTVQPRKWS